MIALQPYLMTPEDGTAALEVNRSCPIDADFSFYFERDPDFFAWPREVFDGFDYFGVRADDRLIAYALIARRAGWVGDGWGVFGYGGDARVLPAYRRHGVFDTLRRTIAASIPHEVEVGFSVVKVGNRAVEHYADRVRERADDPEWSSATLGVLRAYNVLFIPSTRTTNGLHVRRATEADVPAILELRTEEFRGRLFAPRPDDNRLVRACVGRGPNRSENVAPPEYWIAERQGRIDGIAGLWDIDPVHRTRVLRFSWRARLLALAYGVARAWYGGLTPLPPAGGVFKGLCAVDIAIRRRDPTILRSLLDAALCAYMDRGLHFLQIGFMTNDPLCEVLREYRTVPFESHLEVWFRQSWSKRVGMQTMADPYIDLALL
jgi:hypothetical protein